MVKENDIFQREINRISNAIHQIRNPEDLCFCMLSNSCLCDNSITAREHIRALDERVHFDCLVHLGDILRGNNPEKVSRRILRQELDTYRDVLGNGKLFVVQGEQDGYRDEFFCGQLVCGIMRDDIWHEDTSFIDAYQNVQRKGDAPYYYVDFPQYSTRLIFLCSSFCEFDEDNKLFERYPFFDIKQLAWLQNEALKADEGWKVLLFSHAMPKSRFETGKDPFIYGGFSGEKFLNILQRAQTEQKISVVGWCAGHYLFDCETEVASINHIVIGSPAIEEELWDVAVLKTDERKLYLFRFGVGNDRVISY